MYGSVTGMVIASDWYGLFMINSIARLLVRVRPANGLVDGSTVWLLDHPMYYCMARLLVRDGCRREAMVWRLALPRAIPVAVWLADDRLYVQWTGRLGRVHCMAMVLYR
jgi:hypothetical protein